MSHRFLRNIVLIKSVLFVFWRIKSALVNYHAIYYQLAIKPKTSAKKTISTKESIISMTTAEYQD